MDLNAVLEDVLTDLQFQIGEYDAKITTEDFLTAHRRIRHASRMWITYHLYDGARKGQIP